MSRYGSTSVEQLYRLYNAERELLYIGISYSALARIAQHQDDQAWWPEVTSVEVDNFWGVTRSTIRTAEREAIIRENPKYNVAHSTSRRPTDQNDWMAAWRNRGSKCPAMGCGKTSIYDYHNDRFFHEDGSDNCYCWAAMLRGERTA